MRDDDDDDDDGLNEKILCGEFGLLWPRSTRSKEKGIVRLKSSVHRVFQVRYYDAEWILESLAINRAWNMASSPQSLTCVSVKPGSNFARSRCLVLRYICRHVWKFLILKKKNRSWSFNIVYLAIFFSNTSVKKKKKYVVNFIPGQLRPREILNFTDSEH